MKRRANEVQGFSLTEILVSVVIIGVIATLAYPTVSKAIDQARTTGCLSNLRRIGSAFSQYANDHDGVMPYYRPNGSPNPTWRSFLDPYLQWVNDKSSKSLRFCPLNRDLENRGINNFHYAMNYGLPGPFWRFSQVAVPSEGFLITCLKPGGSSVRIVSDEEALMGRQHQNRMAILFIDGHAETREKLPSKERELAAWNRFWNPSKP